jgi:hypothetical protein
VGLSVVSTDEGAGELETGVEIHSTGIFGQNTVNGSGHKESSTNELGHTKELNGGN